MKGVHYSQNLTERITKGYTSARRKEKPKEKMQLKSKKKWISYVDKFSYWLEKRSNFFKEKVIELNL